MRLRLIRWIRDNVIKILAPCFKQITIRELVTGLARIPRCAGQTTTALPYSVAQHSVLVARLTEYHGGDAADIRLAALLHDAHEFVTGDITRPVQQAIAHILPAEVADPIKHLQAMAQAAILDRFAPGLNSHSARIAAVVSAADDCALVTERRDLRAAPSYPECHRPTIAAAPHQIQIWPWAKAAEEFIKAYAAAAHLLGTDPDIGLTQTI